MAAARLTRTPRMVVLMARSVDGQPCAQTRRSVAVWGCQHRVQCGSKTNTYRHDLAALADDALARTHVDGRAVQTAPRPLDQTRDDEDARLPRDPLQLLARAVAPLRLRLPAALLTSSSTLESRRGELPPHPPVSCACVTLAHDIAEVDGGVEVVGILVPATLLPLADDAAKGRAARVAAEEGLGQ